MKAVAGVLLTLCMSGSWAALGGAPADFGPRVQAAHTRPGSTGLAFYSDVQRTLESGTVVHEYLDAQGTVFAVSWSGPFPPDLKETLGSHFNDMVAQAGRAAPANRRQLQVKQSDVVIVSAGHMGAFEGRAWLPGRLPAGFDPGEIR